MVKTVKKGETDNWLTPASAVYPLVPHLRKFKVGVRDWLERIF